MERRRVVITGLGAVTPIGLTAKESWQAAKDGVCGIAPITQFDPTGMKVHLAAEVKGFVPENYMSKPEAKRMGRFTQMAVVHAKEHWTVLASRWMKRRRIAAASLSPAASAASPSRRQSTTRARRRAGTGLSLLYPHRHLQHGRRPDRHPHRLPGHVLLSGDRLYRRHQCRSDAFHYIRDGYADVMLCGGTESAVTPLAIGASPP